MRLFAASRHHPSLVLLAALAALPFCQRSLPRAVGASGEVTLITDIAADSPAVAAVEAAIAREVIVLRPEPAFRLDRLPAARSREARSWRNLIVVADLNRPGVAAELADEIVGRTVLAEFESGRRAYALYSDVWARGQTVLVLAGPGEGALAARVERERDRIFDAFDRRITRQILSLAFLAGEEVESRRRLERRYGWSIRVPAGYRTTEDPETHFVRFFKREGAAHLLFVHWREGISNLPSPETCLAIRAGLIATHYRGDTIDSTRTHIEEVDFLGRRALKLIGVWQNAEYTMGGPFRTYCFIDGDRFTMLDLAVFAPQERKIDELRRLEAIALSYRDHRRSRAGSRGPG